MVGCAGSSTTGPAPLGGGFSPPRAPSHETPGSGENLGGAELGAPSAAPAETSPAKTPAAHPAIGFGTECDMVLSFGFRDRFARASPSRRNSSRPESEPEYYPDH